MNYKITGKVVKGDGYGRKLGYPTMNLETGSQELPPLGVYSGVAKLEGKEYRAGIISGPLNKMEAHLIGYKGNAYGKEVTLNTNKFLRDYKTFESEKELIEQIRKDIEMC